MTRVSVVSPEPTPYRAPLFDRIARHVELTVIYAAATVAGRSWSVELNHPHVFLRGRSVPGARRLLRHDYPVTPGIWPALAATRPDVVVVSGWSTFASQGTVLWCWARAVPYVLQVESHDLDPRPAWRRAVKNTVATRVIRGARSVLAVGSAARESALERGAREVRIFANTIDIEQWIRRADALTPSPHDDVLVLSVGRDVPDKGFDVLRRAAAEAAVRLEVVTDGLAEDELAQRYVDADVFALLSRHEPWGVVVNEAAASRLPLVLSDRVGAAYDLLQDGENGFLVPVDDADAAASALRKLTDPELRRRQGERSRALVRGWDYDASVEAFLDATSR